MIEDRYVKHVNATATCVELALSNVEDDINRELAVLSGVEADALRRVLAKLKLRRCSAIGLVKSNRLHA